MALFRPMMTSCGLGNRAIGEFGPTLEMEYALKTFGIDLSRQLFRESEPGTNTNDEYDETIEEEVHKRQQLDD